MDEFDYTGYIVKYDRKYNSGNTFRKGCFKIDPERIVPIVEYQGTRCFGGAKLEDRDDGLVTKCVFHKDFMGRFTLGLLELGDCDLSFYAGPIEREEDTVTFGDIKAILLMDRSHKPSIVEE